ncbi:hypothetical protein BMH32_07595 [Leucobacter sp. OLJS4]|uniref:hypothetical protein n=1 Tax=unclassified Leucobacter TaxID=2621730 RepID=UPI000C1A7F38|nr:MULTISPECIES: hypothetical protein [unclassified Leucobacter]PIJ51871.1 hypothetical protein BMH30_03325 [Leucobacter sp. OLES1]PII85364.1 hypothetical protein BMH25_02380 [Leucobacter sp. OLCALW19]PII93144.1 hypothetical protein BMH27_04230 [Leucobacter sp. OLAS13]PII96016.1 hypothetical protein BMH26_01505 [Leucobacter sp. OLTLW20]PII96818.1 hypothetical protein BMH28_14415 [Leucobacter sp. OLCS4]
MRKKSNAEARESTLASGWVVEGDESSTPSDAPAEPQTDEAVPAGDPAIEVGGKPDPDGGPEQASNAVLVLLGVFGGLYALYTWGWFVVAKAYADFNTTVAAGSGSFGQVLQQILFWAAPFATVLWFLSAVLFLRRRALWLGIALVLGAVILVPLPMLVVSAQ